MPTADRLPVALDVIGHLMVEMGGESTQVDALGDRIIVQLPSLRAGLSMIRRRSKGPGRHDSIRRIHDALNLAGLSVEVVLGGSTIGRLGNGARAGRLSRLLGLDPMEIRWGGFPGLLRKRRLPGVTRP